MRFVFLLFIFAGLLFSFCSRTNDKTYSHKTSEVILSFENGKKIYIKASAWGLAGNHEEIVFSDTSMSSRNSKKSFVFYTDEIFYKIDNKSKLIIYAPQSSYIKPVKSLNGIEIEIVDLTNAKEISKFSRNYKQYNLERISIY
ncbi:MAG: hypothetical protein AB7V36_04165 [Bacteroidales bacterium]